MNWIKEHPLESVVILLLVIRAVAALIRKTVTPKEGSRLDGILDLVEGALAHAGVWVDGWAKIKGGKIPEVAPMLEAPKSSVVIVDIEDSLPSDAPTPSMAVEAPPPRQTPPILPPPPQPPRAA